MKIGPTFFIVAALGAYLGWIIMMRKPWDYPETAARYRATIDAAEGQYGIPPKLLGRLLYQESRFRRDIILGDTISSAGAIGIAQIVPKWHPDVDPYDPIASIWYAAKYLSGLKNRFGTWPLALAAYNWGPGNQQADLEDKIVGNEWPLETQKYVREITSDVWV
jgi:soluble lytic murein transglycosylase-like protein